MHHEHAEAQEVDRSPLGINRRILRPHKPGEEVNDYRVIKADEHPAVEVAPAEQLITGDLLVEGWLTGRRKGQI